MFRPTGPAQIATTVLLAALVLPIATAAADDNDPVGGSRARALEQREVTAESVLARDEQALGRPFDPRFRAAVKRALSAFPGDSLAAVPVGMSAEALGDTTGDLVFTPVPPCRIIDTRLAGGVLAAGTTRDFFVAGSFGFAGQGGLNGGCGIPFGPATAVVINFIAVNATGGGNLRAFPVGSPVPNASIVNYALVPGLNIANGLVQPICNPALSFCALDLTIRADVSATHVVADVLGYFAPPSPLPMLWAVVNEDGGLHRAFHAVSSTNLAVGQYEVIFDRDVRGCAFVASIGLSGSSGASNPGEVTVVGRATDPNGVFVTTHDSAGTLANRGFHLQVMC